MNRNEDEAAREEKLVDQVAKAIYDVQVKQAKEVVDRIAFDASEITDLIERLRTETQTAQILIFYSYLDDRVQTLIKAHLHGLDSKNAEEAVFGIAGPLNSFGARTLLAYHLGWISRPTKERLDAFRKVRNEFAHRAFKISIDDPVVASHLATLDVEGSIAASDQPILDGIKLLDPLLSALVVLGFATVRDLLLLPIARTFKVNPDDIYGSSDERPEVLKGISRSFNAALRSLVQKDAPDADHSDEPS